MEELTADVESLSVNNGPPARRKRNRNKNKNRKLAQKERADAGRIEAQKKRDEKRAAPFGYLFDLPLELREQIYKLTLVADPEWDKLHDVESDGRARVWIDLRKRNDGFSGRLRYKSPKLLTVSKRIRAEAGALYHRTTLFLFDEVRVCSAWLKSLSKQFRDEIKRLHYCTGNVRMCSVIDDDDDDEPLSLARQARSLGQDWKTLHAHFKAQGIDMSNVLRVCSTEEPHFCGTENCTWTTDKQVETG